jgi:hypothetical protein
MRLAAATLLVALVLPAAAGGHAPHGRLAEHLTTNPVALAVQLAERYWQATPCHGDMTVTGSATIPGYIDAGPAQGAGPALAWAGFTATDWTNPATYTRCRVFFNLGFWRDWRTEDGNFQWFCDTMTHELGHLFGHRDDGQTDPSTITYPLLGPDTANYNSVPQCQRVVLWYAGQRIVGR